MVGATKLTAVMTGSEVGRSIAKHFFHAEDPADLVDRATRAGGPLRTPDDLFEREGAIGDFLRTAGPHFDFHSERSLPVQCNDQSQGLRSLMGRPCGASQPPGQPDIADREERRPTMSEPTVRRPVPAGMRALRDVLARGQWEVELVPVTGDQAPMEIEFRRP